MAFHQHQNQDKDAVQQLFTTTALNYSELFLPSNCGSNFSFRQRLTLATQMTKSISGSLLECACGTGEITAAILASERFTNATIIDLSPRMLELAKQRMAVELKKPGICKLEFKSSDIFGFASQPLSKRYDLILCLGLIAHAGRLDDLLVKLKQLLTAQGCILLQTSLLDHIGTKLVRTLTRKRYYRKHGYQISYFHHQDILRAVQCAGLKNIAMRRFTFGFPFGDRIWATMNYHLELRMQNWSKLHGSEAMYLLQSNSHEH